MSVYRIIATVEVNASGDSFAKDVAASIGEFIKSHELGVLKGISVKDMDVDCPSVY